MSEDEFEPMFQRAEQDDPEATFKISLHYQYARGDMASANYWLIKAANLEHPVALYNYALRCLSDHYRNVPTNRELGIALLKKSKEKGFEDAEEKLKKILQRDD